MGYTVYNSEHLEKPIVKRFCPFHSEKLEVTRLYGDETFNDGKRKLQLRCPVCFYSERYMLKCSTK